MRHAAWLAVWMSLVASGGCSQAPEGTDSAYSLTVRARAFLESGQTKRARRLLAHVADAASSADAWTNLGIVEAQLGHRERAEACWQTAVGLDKRCARAFYQLGMSERTRGEEILAGVQPGSRRAEKQRSEGRALLEGAAEAIGQAAASAPVNAVLRQVLADLDVALGKAEPAKKARDEAGRLDPQGVGAVWDRASLVNLVLPVRPRPQDAAQLPLHFEPQATGQRALGVTDADLDSDGRVDLVLLGSGVGLRADSLPGSERVGWARLSLVPDRPIQVVCAGLLDADDRPDLVLFTSDEPSTSPADVPAPEARRPVARRTAPRQAVAPVTASKGMHAWLLRGGGGRVEPLRAVPYAVRQAAALDVDGDGDLDLVLGVAATPGLRIWRNEGNGRFEADVPVHGLEGIPPVGALVCADFDGDQRADLVCADDLGRWRVLVQRPGGSFADVTSQTGVTREPARVLAAADLDADGCTDLLVGSDSGLWVYANRGGAHFAPQSAYRVPQTAWSDMRPRGVAVGALFLADLDNDGQSDIVTLQVASGAPQAPAPPARSGPAQIAAAPVPPAGGEDTSPSLPGTALRPLPAASLCRLSVWRNAGRGVFLDDTARLRLDLQPLLLAMPVAADLDHDGDLDLAVVGADSLVQVLWNEGGDANRRLEVQLAGPCGAVGQAPSACLGTRLEMYAGDFAHSLELRQQSTWIGVGGHTHLEVLRLTWPDGSVQSLVDVDLPASGRLRLGRAASGS